MENKEKLKELKNKFNKICTDHLSRDENILVETLLKRYKNMGWTESKSLNFIIELIESGTLSEIQFWYL